MTFADFSARLDAEEWIPETEFYTAPQESQLDIEAYIAELDSPKAHTSPRPTLSLRFN